MRSLKLGLLSRLPFTLLVLSVAQIYVLPKTDAQVYYRSSAPTAYRSYRPSYSSGYSTIPRRSTGAIYYPATGRIVYPSRSTGYSRSSYPSSYRGSPAPSSRSRVKKAPYRLDAGDVVAILVQGVTGDFSKAPIHMPGDGKDDIIPSVGHPMVVLPDGTLPMPLIDPLYVRGLTVTEARAKASRAYLDQEILKKDKQVTLSLTRKRTVSVSVLHDNPALAIRGVSNVKLPSDRADVLNALAGSGTFDRDAAVSVINSRGARGSSSSKLSDGDVVQLQSPPAGFFFTGGNLNGGQFALPTDRRINALQAISIAGGAKVQNLIGPRQVTVIRRGGGAIRVPYAQVLNNPNSVIMMPGDTLLLK